MTIEVLREVGTPPQSAAAGGDPGEHFPFQPPPSMARFLPLTVPPDSRVDRSRAAVEAVTAEIRQKIPDLLGVLGPGSRDARHRDHRLRRRCLRVGDPPA
jgi:hypothetical protein